MTEHEWMTSIDLPVMLASLLDHASDRKLRLFACGAFRALWGLPSRGVRWAAVDAAEGVADGLVARDDLTRHAEAVHRAWHNARGQAQESFYSAIDVVQPRAWGAAESVAYNPTLDPPERALVVASLLRCIFGNPFRPVTPDPSWLTSTVVGLAHAIYDARAFHDLPILADALQDCGCDDEAVLAHCRGQGPHTRGCYVVDMLTGRA